MATNAWGFQALIQWGVRFLKKWPVFGVEDVIIPQSKCRKPVEFPTTTLSGDTCVQWSDIFDSVEEIQQSNIGFSGFIEHGVGPVACERENPENCFVVDYNQVGFQIDALEMTLSTNQRAGE